jgi:hypothetical protein
MGDLVCNSTIPPVDLEIFTSKTPLIEHHIHRHDKQQHFNTRSTAERTAHLQARICMRLCCGLL